MVQSELPEATGIMDSINPMRKYQSKRSKGSLKFKPLISLTSLPTTSFVHCCLPLLRLRLPLKLRHAALVAEAENLARTMLKIYKIFGGLGIWHPLYRVVWVAVGSQAVRFFQLKHHITQRLILLAHLQHWSTAATKISFVWAVRCWPWLYLMINAKIGLWYPRTIGVTCCNPS